MYDIVALGELLIDFTENGYSKSNMRLFEQNPGGAPCNMLSAATKFGSKTAFIGKVGNDIHGRFLQETISHVGIDTRGLIMDDRVFTTLAFVALADDGEREFSFARRPGADTCLRKEEIREEQEILKNCRIFHFGSLSLTDEPSKSATYEAIKIAKNANAVISYDPNYRAPLWSSVNHATAAMREPLHLVDIMKLSDEETVLLTDNADPVAAINVLHEIGVECVAVTIGKDGAVIGLKNKGCIHVNVVQAGDILDKTGAGDAFWGGFVNRLVNRLVNSNKQPSQLTLDDVFEFGRFANAAAALCISKRGGIPAMPTLQEVKRILEQLEFY